MWDSLKTKIVIAWLKDELSTISVYYFVATLVNSVDNNRIENLRQDGDKLWRCDWWSLEKLQRGRLLSLPTYQ